MSNNRKLASSIISSLKTIKTDVADFKEKNIGSTSAMIFIAQHQKLVTEIKVIF